MNGGMDKERIAGVGRIHSVIGVWEISADIRLITELIRLELEQEVGWHLQKADWQCS